MEPSLLKQRQVAGVLSFTTIMATQLWRDLVLWEQFMMLIAVRDMGQGYLHRPYI
jgi:hypothetical protein